MIEKGIIYVENYTGNSFAYDTVTIIVDVNVVHLRMIDQLAKYHFVVRGIFLTLTYKSGEGRGSLTSWIQRMLAWYYEYCTYVNFHVS